MGYQRDQADNTNGTSTTTNSTSGDGSKPTAAIEPEGRVIEIQEGHGVTFTCKIGGEPPLEFHWEKRSSNGTGRRLETDAKGRLVIKPVGKGDEAEYICIVSNRVGRTMTATKLVVVASPEKKEDDKKSA